MHSLKPSSKALHLRLRPRVPGPRASYARVPGVLPSTREHLFQPRAESRQPWPGGFSRPSRCCESMHHALDVHLLVHQEKKCAGSNGAFEFAGTIIAQSPGHSCPCRCGVLRWASPSDRALPAPASCKTSRRLGHDVPSRSSPHGGQGLFRCVACHLCACGAGEGLFYRRHRLALACRTRHERGLNDIIIPFLFSRSQ